MRNQEQEKQESDATSIVFMGPVFCHVAKLLRHKQQSEI